MIACLSWILWCCHLTCGGSFVCCLDSLLVFCFSSPYIYKEQLVRFWEATTIEDSSSENATAIGRPPAGKLILKNLHNGSQDKIKKAKKKNTFTTLSTSCSYLKLLVEASSSLYTLTAPSAQAAQKHDYMKNQFNHET